MIDSHFTLITVTAMNMGLSGCCDIVIREGDLAFGSRVARGNLTPTLPQVGSRNGAVLSEPVSIPRLVKPGVRISRTRLTLLTSPAGL